MCIAIYKPIGTEFPSKRTLRTCFDNNPHGAGYMVATGDRIIIHKGFMGFRSFWKSLRSTREKYGTDRAYVMHFRISTQGGIREDGCHPFPLSKSMDDLRMLDTTADIAVAHNGIISLCSSYKKGLDYSDTMKFITEYLSLIIKDADYYKDADALKLIEKLCGSRLAILDKSGHCELIGSGWSAENGVWYSNTSYKPLYTKAKSGTTKSSATTYSYTYKPTATPKTWWGDAWDDDEYIYAMYEEYDACRSADGVYDFGNKCPELELGDSSYCEFCRSYETCFGFNWGETDEQDNEKYSA